jgi:isocitrate dehydrogenase (NAD+)
MALVQVLRRVLGASGSTQISSTARAFSSAPAPIIATLFPGDGIGPEIAESVKQVRLNTIYLPLSIS